MANLLRAAFAAALMFGVVAAPNESARGAALDEALTIAPPPVEPAMEPITIPPAEPLAEVELPAVPATSLAQLVARHGGSTPGSRDMECLAGAIYFESKGEPLAGQLAVAHVIRNRAASGRFASTVCGVIHQRGQFSFVRGGSFPPIARSSRAWTEAVGVAHVAANDLWASPVERALFFHARRVSPGWRLARVGTVGNHVFYR